jgi:predicted lipid-binding transport protein (Tim44 family)
MPADLLLFALIAAGLIFWLRSILGTRDENDEEPKRPSLFSDEDKILSAGGKSKKDNVVSLNPSVGDRHSLPAHVRIDNKTTENKLDDLVKEYPKFDVGHFAQGAEGAFSMIVESFAEGDIETLESLLAPEVFEAFKSAIEARNTRGESVDTQIHGVEKLDITDVMIKDDHIFLTVRFSARETCVIKDKSGAIISGDPDKTTIMVDVWVFGRELNFDGPEWYLYETRDDEVEDHKTPLPEGGSDKEKK